jgi:hypothetical protein
VGSTRLTYTGLHGELEHLKLKTRIKDERFASLMGECVIVTLYVRRLYCRMRKYLLFIMNQESES